MQFSTRLLLFGAMPCFAMVFTSWSLTGDDTVRYAYRDTYLLVRVMLCAAVALSWIWITRECVRWGRGNAMI